MKMEFHSLFVASVLILFGLMGALASPSCVGMENPVSLQTCKEYVAEGALDVEIPGFAHVSYFTAEDEIAFKVAIANVSNKYILIEVRPQDVIITEKFINRYDKLIISFMVVNPTGSSIKPVLFRTTELYLLMTLNEETIDRMVPFNVIPIEPMDTYPLFFPPWAIAVICYLVLVIIVYLVVLANQNWHSQMGEDMDEEELLTTKQQYKVNGEPLKYGDNDYAEVTKKSAVPTHTVIDENANDNDQVESKKEGTTDYSGQASPEEIDMSTQNTTTATIESSRSSEATSSAGGENGGVVNEAFDADKEGITPL